ncbi:hypothetical protein SAMN05421642_10562 [Rhodococcoides kyotonense]|uniref:Uncharacterized protein n=1 Tax=Rhodococcoides kyotonense TaxID=398843 RepID=A0A239H392_9NOCA|nr:hypothetical protein SAMN05421642_10562 [Rhodococcus kyotonensis]
MPAQVTDVEQSVQIVARERDIGGLDCDVGTRQPHCDAELGGHRGRSLGVIVGEHDDAPHAVGAERVQDA